jgi:hypothetical protein
VKGRKSKREGREEIKTSWETKEEENIGNTKERTKERNRENRSERK